jgi:hypothetical protein
MCVRIHLVVDFDNTSLGHTGSYISERQDATGSFKDEHIKTGGSVTPDVILTGQGHTYSIMINPIWMS